MPGAKDPLTADVQDTPQEPETTPTPVEPEATPVETPPDGTKTFSAEYVAELRKEAASYRKQLRDAEKAAEEEQARKAQEEQAQLTEQGKFKELATKQAAEITALKAQAEQAEKYRAVLEKHLTVQREGLPEHITALLDRLDVAEQLEWLAANAEAVKPTTTAQKPADKLSAFNPQGGGQVPETDEQRIARLRRNTGQMSTPF